MIPDLATAPPAGVPQALEGAAAAAAVPPYWAPPADSAAVGWVLAAITAAGLGVERNRPLGPMTTFGIGGPAAGFVEAADAAALRVVLRALAGTSADDVPLLVMGRGSNMLVSDDGFPGVVLRLGRGFKAIGRGDGSLADGDGAAVGSSGVSAGAAVAMPALAAWTAKESLTGLEFGAGIPGSVGGCVRMNAGAHGGEVADRLIDADVMVVGGEPRRMAAAELRFGYRRSVLPARAVVTAARFRLHPDDPARIRARLDELRTWRRATQPLRERNCGSVFTNPAGDSAGRLIEAAGLKGRRCGGARVSGKHANFIVVAPGTRARDVLDLITAVRAGVRAAGGPLLTPEVRVVGRFGVAPGAADEARSQ